MTGLRTARDMIQATFADWMEDRAARLAAALAYYTTFSLARYLVSRSLATTAGSCVGSLHA